MLTALELPRHGFSHQPPNPTVSWLHTELAITDLTKLLPTTIMASITAIMCNSHALHKAILATIPVQLYSFLLLPQLLFLLPPAQPQPKATITSELYCCWHDYSSCSHRYSCWHSYCYHRAFIWLLLPQCYLVALPIDCFCSCINPLSYQLSVVSMNLGL